MAKLQEIKEALRRRWHQDTAEQGEWLGAVVRGFFERWAAYGDLETGSGDGSLEPLAVQAD